MVKLSKRMQAVADLVTPGRRVCDVGTDHGYIPLYLLCSKRIPYAYAMDVNQGPLQKAQEHIAREQMEQYIETRLSDGLSALAAGEAETIIIAGMGGGLIIRILEENFEKLEAVKELILQPQSDVEQVRRYVDAHGYRIEKEELIKEDGKYYFPFRCIPAAKAGENVIQKHTYFRYGEHLIRSNHPLLQEYLSREECQLLSIRASLCHQNDSASARVREQEISEKLAVIAAAREEMASNAL